MTFKEDFKPTKVYNKLVNDVLLIKVLLLRIKICMQLKL